MKLWQALLNILCLFLVSPAILGVPWLAAAELPFPPWLLPVFSLCTCLTWHSPHLVRTPAYRVRVYHDDLMLIWLYLQRLYFQIRPYSQVLEVRTSTYLSAAHNSTPNRGLHSLTSTNRYLSLYSYLPISLYFSQRSFSYSSVMKNLFIQQNFKKSRY